MGLLHPALLLLGLGIAVPLILHLFQRHQGPRVVFPALRYLRRAEHESARKVRLRQILLMLLRMAAVLLVAFAAARPFIRAAGAGHEPTAVVIILDNSMSSGAVSGDVRVIDGLKARALETIAVAEPEDRFWLLRAGAADEPAYPGDAIETARRIRETEPTDGAADIVAAVTRARAILASGAQKRAPEIQLLTDDQASNVRGSVRGAPGDAQLVILHATTMTPPNRAVTDVMIGGGIAPGAGERSTLAASIGGNADANAKNDSANVRLIIDGRLAAAARAPSGGIALLQLPARPAGVLTGWVEMDADAVRADNRRYFATNVSEPPTVAVSGTAPFIGEALSALESAGRVKRGAAQASGVTLLPGGGQSAVISPGRTSVIFPPESPLELEALNRRLAASGIPWSYALQPTPGEARFAIADTTDALLRTLQSARLRSVYTLRPAPAAEGDSVLLRLQDGGAWALRGDRASGGRYILLATPLTETASNIPTSAAMLPLLDRIIRTWSASRAGTEEAVPGDFIALPAGADAVLRPDSVKEPVDDSRYRVPARAGIYEIMAGNKILNAFAVNTPPAESDLAMASVRDVGGAFPQWKITNVDAAKDWKKEIFRNRVGREMWRSLLLALLAVLVIEALVAATGGARARTNGATQLSEAA